MKRKVDGVYELKEWTVNRCQLNTNGSRFEANLF